MEKQKAGSQRTGNRPGNTKIRLYSCFSTRLELGIVEAGVEPAFFQQFFVTPLFHHIAVVQNQNPVGVPNGGKPMGDDKTGAVFHDICHRFLQLLFQPGIHAP